MNSPFNRAEAAGNHVEEREIDLPINSIDVSTSKPGTASRNILRGEHDAIIAELLVKKHGNNLIFDTSKGQWKVFSDGTWIEAEDAARMVLGFYYRIILDIADNHYPDLEIGDEKWLKKQMNQGKYGSVSKLVQVLVAQGIDKLNANHNLIGIRDMVYDISTNTCRPAVASDLVTKSLATNFDAQATCTKWDSFLKTAMQNDEQMIGYLQRLAGYFLTASTKEQEIYYFYGTGANGKSTFLDLIKTLLGTYGVKIASDTFIRGYGGAGSTAARASLASLAGARLAITDETTDGDAAFDVQSLKSISGDDEVTGRFLRQNPITFKSTAKVVMYGNDKPYGNINDEGFWRRFRFIHFGHVVPKEDRNPHLLEELKEELPGILNWALAGLADLNKNGLQTPQKVLNDGDNYRKDLDSVSEFLRDNTADEAGQKIPLKMLFERYTNWCANNLKNAETKQGFSKRTAWYFDTQMKGKVTPFRTSKDRGYKGIRLI